MPELHRKEFSRCSLVNVLVGQHDLLQDIIYQREFLEIAPTERRAHEIFSERVASYLKWRDIVAIWHGDGPIANIPDA